MEIAISPMLRVYTGSNENEDSRFMGYSGACFGKPRFDRPDNYCL
jgi:hypothetical protein